MVWPWLVGAIFLSLAISIFILVPLALIPKNRGEIEISFYADEVDYFDNGKVTKEFVVEDIKKYNQRWPGRRSWVDGEPKVEMVDSAHDVARAVVTLRFVVQSRQKTIWGSCENVIFNPRWPCNRSHYKSEGQHVYQFRRSLSDQTFTGWIPAGTPLATDDSIPTLQGKKIKITGRIELYRGPE